MEKYQNYPKKSFQDILPLCINDPYRASIIYDFFDLIVDISAHSHQNKMNGQKVTKLAGLWAFKTNSPRRSTICTYEEGVETWLPASQAMLHLSLSFLRSIVAENRKLKISPTLPKPLQALLASSVYPPKPASELKLINVPLITLKSDSLSKNPTELLLRVSKSITFNKPDVFNVDDFEVLKYLFENPIDMFDKLTPESCRILKRIENSMDINTDNGLSWTSKIPLPVANNNNDYATEESKVFTVSLSDVPIADYYIWAWMASLSPEVSESKKIIFGRSVIVEVQIDSLNTLLNDDTKRKRWVIVDEILSKKSTLKHRSYTAQDNNRNFPYASPPAVPPKDSPTKNNDINRPISTVTLSNYKDYLDYLSFDEPIETTPTEDNFPNNQSKSKSTTYPNDISSQSPKKQLHNNNSSLNENNGVDHEKEIQGLSIYSTKPLEQKKVSGTGYSYSSPVLYSVYKFNSSTVDDHESSKHNYLQKLKKVRPPSFKSKSPKIDGTQEERESFSNTSTNSKRKMVLGAFDNTLDRIKNTTSITERDLKNKDKSKDQYVPVPVPVPKVDVVGPVAVSQFNSKSIPTTTSSPQLTKPDGYFHNFDYNHEMREPSLPSIDNENQLPPIPKQTITPRTTDNFAIEETTPPLKIEPKSRKNSNNQYNKQDFFSTFNSTTSTISTSGYETAQSDIDGLNQMVVETAQDLDLLLSSRSSEMTNSFDHHVKGFASAPDLGYNRTQLNESFPSPSEENRQQTNNTSSATNVIYPISSPDKRDVLQLKQQRNVPEVLNKQSEFSNYNNQEDIAPLISEKLHINTQNVSVSDISPMTSKSDKTITPSVTYRAQDSWNYIRNEKPERRPPPRSLYFDEIAPPIQEMPLKLPKQNVETIPQKLDISSRDVKGDIQPSKSHSPSRFTPVVPIPSPSRKVSQVNPQDNNSSEKPFDLPKLPSTGEVSRLSKPSREVSSSHLQKPLPGRRAPPTDSPPSNNDNIQEQKISPQSQPPVNESQRESSVSNVLDLVPTPSQQGHTPNYPEHLPTSAGIVGAPLNQRSDNRTDNRNSNDTNASGKRVTITSQNTDCTSPISQPSSPIRSIPEGSESDLHVDQKKGQNQPIQMPITMPMPTPMQMQMQMQMYQNMMMNMKNGQFPPGMPYGPMPPLAGQYFQPPQMADGSQSDLDAPRNVDTGIKESSTPRSDPNTNLSDNQPLMNPDSSYPQDTQQNSVPGYGPYGYFPGYLPYMPYNSQQPQGGVNPNQRLPNMMYPPGYILPPVVTQHNGTEGRNPSQRSSPASSERGGCSPSHNNHQMMSPNGSMISPVQMTPGMTSPYMMSPQMMSPNMKMPMSPMHHGMNPRGGGKFATRHGSPSHGRPPHQRHGVPMIPVNSQLKGIPTMPNYNKNRPHGPLSKADQKNLRAALHADTARFGI